MESIEAVQKNGLGRGCGLRGTLDRVDDVGDAVEDAAAECLLGQLAEPALDDVQPRARGRGEVQVGARVLGEPGADVVGFVGAVVVDDQVQFALAVVQGRNTS